MFDEGDLLIWRSLLLIGEPAGGEGSTLGWGRRCRVARQELARARQGP